VFFVVAETGSVTAAAGRLYLTQPAVSAALKRLRVAVGAPLFAREGRGLVLTARGEHLLRAGRPHLEALLGVALAPAAFDLRSCDRTLRIGASDMSEEWLLPPLLRALRAEAPLLRLVILPVQFRTVGDALTSRRVDVAVSVADDMPADIRRSDLFHGGFRCLFDPRHTRLGRAPTLARYLAQEHIIVSYNGDLAGVVEDTLQVQRKVRLAIATFHAVGAAVDGTSLVATVPEHVARATLARRPALRDAKPPFNLEGVPMEMLWRAALEDDPAVAFLRDQIVRIARTTSDGRASSRVSPPRPRTP